MGNKIDTKVNQLVINKLTRQQFDAAPEKSSTELYLVTDDTTFLNKDTADGLYQVKGEYATKGELAGKVDKVNGKGLSTNDYTAADKNLVGTISGKLDSETAKTTYAVKGTEGKVTTLEGYFNDQGVAKQAQKANNAAKLNGKNEAALKTDILNGKAATAGTADTANALKTSAREAIINDARKGYDTATVADGKYAKKAVEGYFVQETATGTTMELLPNKLYVFGNVTGGLSITFGAPVPGEVNEYRFQFTAGEGTSLTITENVKWFGGKAPVITSGKTYEVSILNNLAVFGEV